MKIELSRDRRCAPSGGPWRGRAVTASLHHLITCCLLALLAPAAPGSANEVLYEKTSAYGTIVVVQEEEGLRSLRFGRYGVRQSLVKQGDPDYLGLPYLRVALAGMALTEAPRRILVVGLGGGTLPVFLHRHYPDATIDAVDIDPEVVFVAKEFFGFRENDRLRAHIADGRKFVEDIRQPYDAIFLDAFGADNVPPHLATREFLGAVRRGVNPGGVVVGNIWDNSYNRLYDAMVRTYREVFDELYVLRVSGTGNRILLALPRRLSLTPVGIARLARNEAEARRFGFDLGDVVDDSLPRAVNAGQKGRVLRDAELKK